MKWILSLLIGITAVLLYDNLASNSILQQARPFFSNLLHTTKTVTTSHIIAAAPTLSHLPLIPTHFASTGANTGNMTTPRGIQFAFLARQQSEGAGATVRRSVGTPTLRHLTPFLMLDHFSVSPGAGFPDHPHRGQETITYLLSGGVDHEDFAGNKGTIGPGDLQFM
jgi:quercetin 2,3-dioxygenase